MKSIKIMLLFPLVFFVTKGRAQQISCADTVVSTGYFYFIKLEMPKGTAPNESQVYRKPYFIETNIAGKHSIDEMVALSKTQPKDTIKYISYTPKLSTYYTEMIKDSACLDLFKNGISIDSNLNPIQYFKIKKTSSFKRKAMVGFSYVKVQWLHLKITDQVADDNFNMPYTLADPKGKPGIFDIYIPLKLIEVDNNIGIKNRKILEKK